MKLKNVLGLFDGISCGQLALERAGVTYENYYASEIDKYAMAVTQRHYPDTIQLGDINKWEDWNLPSIDLLIGGSPCQGFSFAGKQLNFEDPRSKLFFEYVKVLKHHKPKYFLLENVRMKKEFQDIISEYLGVQPIAINSNLVSAQNRYRLYWTNIPNITQPEDKGILLKDILENIPNKNLRDLPIALLDTHSSSVGLKCLAVLTNTKPRLKDGKILQRNFSQGERIYSTDGKCPTLSANGGGTAGNSVLIHTDCISPASIVGRRLNANGVREDNNKEIPINQCLQANKNSSNSRCLTTVSKDCVVSKSPTGRYPNAYTELKENFHWRRLTVVECERLQTVPDNYTQATWVKKTKHGDKIKEISNSQRYKMLGNGWTVDVIAHIFRHLH